jgi:hypothetical protein
MGIEFNLLDIFKDELEDSENKLSSIVDEGFEEEDFTPISII